MKNLIKRILNEELNNREIILFNKINEKQKELKLKKNIIEYIENLCKFLGLDPKMSQYYYLLWKSNYQKSGDYSNIPPEEFVKAKDLPRRTISNTQAGEFVRGKVPFKGSNLYGEWKTDGRGVEYYVVISYGWYPVYLFKENKWYRISNTYSSSTSRQISNADPIGWDENVERDFTWVTKDEMGTLMRGATYEEIMRGKVEGIVKKKEQFISKKPKFAKNWAYGANTTPIKARFKVTDIRDEGDKAVVDVTIDDAGLREKQPARWGGGMETTNRMIASDGGYLRGELEGVTKEGVEIMIKNHILRNFKDYIGKYPGWSNNTYDLESTPEKHAIKFNFIHSKE